jgi:hypothetical protein
MVGDIIQDPGNALIGGAWAAGSWAIHAAVEAYQKNFNQLDQFSRDFLNGFTADDLVDLPPPPAEDLGTVEPEAGTDAKPTTGSSSPAYTWEDYYQEMWEQERARGIQTPLGPEDPNVVLAPVPTQQKNKDPQAPLKPGFAYSPEPAARQSAGSNLVLEYKDVLGYNYNPANSPDYVTYPVFRGAKGSQKSITFDQALFFAVPVFTDEGIEWKARIQTLVKGRVTATWNLDAGGKAPQSQDFDLWFKDLNGAFDLSIFQYPFPSERRTSFPLTASALPDLVPVPETPGLFEPGGFLDKDREPWTPMPNGADPETDLEPGDLPYPRVPIPPDLLKPPKLPDAVPLNPNNPVAQPNVGTDGKPLPGKGLVPITGPDVHKIGKILVNTGGIRSDITSVAKEVGRIEQKTANTAKSIFDFIDSADDVLEILEKFLPPQKTPAKELSMNAFCDETAEGEPLTMSIAYPEEEMLPAIISRLDDIPAWLEQHLAWKTPTCTNEKPAYSGEWRTISFRSDSVSPFGKSRLRKRFRYCGQQGLGLGEVVEHWKDFAFQSGPVIVQHLGSSWGSPKVWAATADEGKRVIRHAAGEAGIDPDQDGRWQISGSNSARLGVSDTMRVDTKGGYYWITARDGSDERPLVAKT